MRIHQYLGNILFKGGNGASSGNAAVSETLATLGAHRSRRWLASSKYLKKMKGAGKGPPRLTITDGVLIEMLWAWFGSALGIGICAYLSIKYFEPSDSSLLIGSFGASAVLVYGAIKSPLAQPRNLIGGHVLSAFVGVACYKMFGQTWIGASLAVSLSIAIMVITNTVHPPGGATALIAIIGADRIHALSFLYPLVPVGLGVLVLLVIALLVNNIPRNRNYPEYWL